MSVSDIVLRTGWYLRDRSQLFEQDCVGHDVDGEEATEEARKSCEHTAWKMVRNGVALSSPFDGRDTREKRSRGDEDTCATYL
eukprot:589707-Rhodomonas_salina.1